MGDEAQTYLKKLWRAKKKSEYIKNQRGNLLKESSFRNEHSWIKFAATFDLEKQYYNWTFFILMNECSLGPKVFMIIETKWKVVEAETWNRLGLSYIQ